jgi:hypothetical protein
VRRHKARSGVASKPKFVPSHIPFFLGANAGAEDLNGASNATDVLMNTRAQGPLRITQGNRRNIEVIHQTATAVRTPVATVRSHPHLLLWAACIHQGTHAARARYFINFMHIFVF